VTASASVPAADRSELDVAAVRADFPILASTTAHGHPLVYLDNAATSQKPQSVIDRVAAFYAAENANIHRGVYGLSAEATETYDAARATAARFLGARRTHEVIFTRGTTEGINLVAQSYARPLLRPGDEIVVTAMEHHSNIVPWQLVAEQTGAVLRVAPITDAGELPLDELEATLSERTRLLAVTYVSNALGTINPVADIARLARGRGIPVLIDGAQAVPHLPIDVVALDCDFFVCSGHKMFGPMGIGLLYGRETLLDKMVPWQGGGDMIASVSFERSTWAPLPAKFEAGTPHVAGAIGLAAAIDYVSGIGLDAIATHEHFLLEYATAQVGAIPGVRLVGTARNKAAVLSFVMDGAHPHDVATVLDERGVCIRAGHHCAQPLLRRLGVPATARASFAFYNSVAEVDALARALWRVREVFA
jgi:cysteine desulfurase / selenocysteine lyase